MPPAKTVQRLRRLLLAVPYVIRHPGTPVAELARSLGVAESELTEDLAMLTMTGLPPYTPAELIEVDVEDGRIWIRMADMFARPLRLTRAEALDLYLRGTELAGSPGLEEAEALRSALGKLKESLGPDVLGDVPAEAAEAVSPGPLAEIRRAVSEHERVEIEHYSAARDEVLTRRIDPEQIFRATGYWYVAAWCHLVEGERMFRVDRIRDVRPTGETFEPRGLMGQGRPLYTRSRSDIPVRLLLRPEARWVAEYYEVEQERERGEDLEVVLPTKDLAWVAKLVLRLGGSAEVLEPPEARDLAIEAAREALAAYR